MGKVHGSPLWRKPASPLDFAPPRPKSVQFHEVIWTTTCGPGVAESCYGRSAIRLPDAPPEVLRGNAPCFFFKNDYKSKNMLKS